MRRWVKRAIAEHQLNEVEAEFVQGVFNSTHGVPRVARRGFVRDTAEMLSGRPPAERPSELVEALGQPIRYAHEWLHEEGFDRWVSPWRRWWLQPRWARAAQVAVLAVLVLGGGMARSYYGATPEIGNNCSGARGPQVERLQAAGATEYVMPFEPGVRYGIHLCPGAPEGVTIERVYLASPGEIGIQPVGYEVAQSHAELNIVGDASKRDPISNDYRQLTVWFEGEYCNSYGGGSSFSISALSVDYRYRGRVRTTTVPLNAHYSFVFDDQCSEDDRAATSDRWRRAVTASPLATSATSWLRFGYEGLGPLQLTPESISRDLCRYLRGVTPSSAAHDQFEPLETRAVFQLEQSIAEPLIDGAVLGVCPEFAERREEFYALVSP